MPIDHEVSIDAPQEAVFALYQDVASWPLWDSETKSVEIDGGLVVGAAGWLKPKSGPRAKITVTEVTRGQSFMVEGHLPLCRMRFGHDLTFKAGETRARHTVTFSGPLAFLFRRAIGAGIDATLPQTLAGLKRAAEAA